MTSPAGTVLEYAESAGQLARRCASCKRRVAITQVLSKPFPESDGTRTGGSPPEGTIRTVLPSLRETPRLGLWLTTSPAWTFVDVTAWPTLTTKWSALNARRACATVSPSTAGTRWLAVRSLLFFTYTHAPARMAATTTTTATTQGQRRRAWRRTWVAAPGALLPSLIVAVGSPTSTASPPCASPAHRALAVPPGPTNRALAVPPGPADCSLAPPSMRSSADKATVRSATLLWPGPVSSTRSRRTRGSGPPAKRSSASSASRSANSVASGRSSCSGAHAAASNVPSGPNAGTGGTRAPMRAWSIA